MVSTSAKERQAKIPARSNASLREIFPETRGLSRVRFTSPSNFRSARSLIMHPADRVSMVPSVKTTSRPHGGMPSEAIHKAAKVGHNSK